MKAVVYVLLAACAAEETVLPPLVPVAEEPVPPIPPEPTTPPPVAERDVQRCERAKDLQRAGFEAMSQQRYEEAKKSYLKAIELDPADRESPAQLARIDKLTENQVGSGTAIEYAQSIGAARAPCEPPKKVAKAPPPRSTPAPEAPGLTEQGTPSTEAPKTAAVTPPSTSTADVRQDGNVIITAKDQKATKQLPTTQEVQKRLTKEDARIVNCYTAALGRDPQLTGKATYQLTLDKEGKVAELKTSDSSLYDQPMDACISSVLKHVHLGKKLGGQVEVYYALTFSPRRVATNDQRRLNR